MDSALVAFTRAELAAVDTLVSALDVALAVAAAATALDSALVAFTRAELAAVETLVREVDTLVSAVAVLSAA